MPVTAASNPLALLLQQRSALNAGGGGGASVSVPPPSGQEGNPLAPNPAALLQAAAQSQLTQGLNQNRLANPEALSSIFKKMRKLSAALLAIAGEQYPSIGKHATAIYKSADAAVGELEKEGPPSQPAPQMSFSGAALQGAPYATPSSRIAS